MAPKRKAPISGLKPTPSAKSNNKPNARPPPAKKARVEVEYESSAPSTKGKGPAAAAPSKGGKAAGGGGGAGKGAAGGKQGGAAGGGGLNKKKSTENLAASAPPPAAKKDFSKKDKKDAKKKQQQQPNKKKVAFPDDTNNDFSQPVGVSSSSSAAQPSLLARHPAPTQVEQTPIAPRHPLQAQIIAGSYEKLLYGLTFSLPPLSLAPYHPSSFLPSSSSGGYDWDLKPVFIFPAHQGAVKAVGSSEGGKWLASGSTDEIVKIWDLRKRREVGGLLQHSGSITSLIFPTRSHLLTASEDATLSLFRTRDWSLLRSFKGHTGRINSVAVHPTGKVALSVGVDRTLRMWDLMKGKAGGSTKIHKEGEIIRFSPSGTHLALLSQTTLDLYTVDMRLITTFTNPKRFHDFAFLTVPSLPAEEEEEGKERELLFASTEEGEVRVWERLEWTEEEVRERGEREKEREKKGEVGGDDESDGDEEEDEEEPLENWKEIARFGGHTNRVKALSLLYPLLSTISSDGLINLYLITALPPSSSSSSSSKADEPLPVILPVTSYDTKGTRLTCMTMCIVTEPGMGSEAGSEFGGVEDQDLDEDDESDEDGMGESGEEGSEGEEGEGSDGFEENPGYAGEEGEMEGESEEEDEGEYE